MKAAKVVAAQVVAGWSTADRGTLEALLEDLERRIAVALRDYACEYFAFCVRSKPDRSLAPTPHERRVHEDFYDYNLRGLFQPGDKRTVFLHYVGDLLGSLTRCREIAAIRYAQGIAEGKRRCVEAGAKADDTVGDHPIIHALDGVSTDP